MQTQQFPAGASASQQASYDEQYLAIMKRFKAEGWPEEKLTRALVDLAQAVPRPSRASRAAPPPPATQEKKSTDMEFLALKAQCKRESWSEEKYTQRLADLAASRKGTKPSRFMFWVTMAW